jgi:hypothetical protein
LGTALTAVGLLSADEHHYDSHDQNRAAGSGPGASFVVLIAGLAAVAAFVTVRRLDTIRR